MTATAAPRLTWRRPWYGAPLGLCLLLLLVALRLFDPTMVERLRLTQFDVFHRLAPRGNDGLTVWIVDVDEESLRALGQWPWPRWRLARLIEQLHAGGIAGLGIDMVFDQPDRMSPPLYSGQTERLPRALREALSELPSTDERLAEALSKGQVSVAALGLDFRLDPAAFRAPRTVFRNVGGGPMDTLASFKDAVRSLPLLTLAAAGEGLANAMPEQDNIVRRVPVVSKVADTLMPSLGFDTLRLAIGARNFSVVSQDGVVAGVIAADVAVPTTGDGRLWLHFTPHRPERFISATDLIEGRVDASMLRGQIVLLGSTAYGLGDFHATPLDPRTPGVEIQAQAIENMANTAFLLRGNHADLIEAALILGVGLLVVFLVPYPRPLLAGALVAAGGLALFGVSFGLFVVERQLLDVTGPIGGTAILVGQMLVAQLRTTDQERKRIASALAREREIAARVEGEMTAARQIQMGMLPQIFPQVAGFEIAAGIEPAKAVGGDFYDVRLLDDGRVYFAIGDVSGKGVAAALFMALSQSLARANARLETDIARIVTETNRELSAENPAMMFVTLIAGLLDPRTGELTFTNAGHDAPIRIGADASLETLEGDGGPPLCVIDDLDYPALSATLAPGQSLVLFTDGVTEATALDQSLYGMERLHAVLGGCASASAARTVAAVVEDVAAFARGADPADDVTVLVLRRYLSEP